MKKSLFLVGAALLALGSGAHAQGRGFGGNDFGGNNGRNSGAQNRGGNGGGAALPLPEGVESVVSIDAYNILMAQTNRDGRRDLAPIIVRHIYSGGVAKLFGGGSIPTEQFVTPGALNGAGGGGRNSGVSGVGGGIGGAGIGGIGGGIGGQTGGFGGLGGQTAGGIGGQTGGFASFQMRPSAFRGRN